MISFALLKLVSASYPHRCVYLVVGAVLLLALAALQQVSGGATSFGHLVFPDGLLGENVPQLLQLITGHFLYEDRGVKKDGAEGTVCRIVSVEFMKGVHS